MSDRGTLQDIKDAEPNLELFRLFIGGETVDASSGGWFESLNPYTGRPWALVADGGAADVDAAVKAARIAFRNGWGHSSGFDRAAVLRTIAAAVSDNAERLALLEVRDSGKLLREMRAQVEALSSWYLYFAGLADKLEGKTVPAAIPSSYFMYTTREPVGVVGAITPWNSPLLLLTFKLAPLLAAGCTCVCKPSEHAPASTVAFAELLHQAGLPAGVLNVVTGSNADTGAALAAHRGVDKVAFTGSNATGVKIARAASANINKVTLELGGKSPQLVFDDADLAAAANGLVAGVFAAAGQTCMAGSRLIVDSSVKDELVERVVDRANSIRQGDPLLAETEMGPMANRPQFEKVLAYLDEAKKGGGKVACGGEPNQELGGLFLLPTVVLTDPSHVIAREEVFGPVLAVCDFSSEDEGIALANDTPFGLAAGIWTKDVHRAHRVAARLRVGTIWINAYRVVAPNMPFGGFKLSGIGRENGSEAINDYLEPKSVFVELTGGTRDPFKLG